ncbi:hypothetical protein AZOA_39760 [Azoarcus sp. Aa7]|nr:hypothetical protein [Azoarcus sp. Aa7]
MTKKGTASLRQEAYAHRCLETGDVLERLHCQWMAIYQLESASTNSDADALQTSVSELDLDLVRYALRTLQTHLHEVAVRDCAQLIAERVLDTAADQPSTKRWKEWLTAAPFWPKLAETNWNAAVAHAFEIVTTTLDEAGVAMDEEAKRNLCQEIAGLRINDLIPKALASELFPVVEEAEAEVGNG